MPATYEPIATTTFAGGTASATFSSIPATYTDLVMVSFLRAGSTNSSYVLRFNSDSGSNYSNTVLYGDGTSPGSNRYSSQTSAYLTYYGFPTTASTFGTIITDFQNYSNTTTNKTFIGRSQNSNSGTDAVVGLWRSTAAINSITIYAGDTFASGSVVTLYGIKAA